jgi:putative drug exporter of the RND superfamily
LSSERRLSFASLGRFTVRFRWIIVVAWVVGTVALTFGLPGIASVEKSSNSQFLPATEPSVHADRLAEAFRSGTTSQAVLVAATTSGQLSATDSAAITRAESAVAKVPHVVGVSDQGVSADGRARQAVVTLDLPPGSTSPAAVRTVADIRRTVASIGAPPGLAVHLTGDAARTVDQQTQQSKAQKVTEILSVLFILLLLFITFRALLAPFIALLPSGIALIAAEPLIAASAHVGVQVSDLTPVLLVVVMLGAGTDYGLFLIFRVREEIRRGLAPFDAVAFSLAKVGESITFSGLTVIAALVTVVIATFGLYKGFGPALAIGIGMALFANLTLLPALLAICGRAVFWPRIPVAGQVKRGAWGRIAAKIVSRPVLTFVSGLIFLGGLALAMLAYSPTGFDNQGVPAAADSAKGQGLLAAHYPMAESDPTDIVFRLPVSVWDRPGVLTTATHTLRSSDQFSSVTGPLDPSGTAVTATELVDAHRQLADAGAADALPATPPVGYTGSLAAYNAYKASPGFISGDGRTLQFPTSLSAGSSTSTAAASAMPAVREVVARTGHAIGATASGVVGYAAVAADVGGLSMHDLIRIIPIVMLVLGILLGIVLRSLVAPLYLVASVALSYLASLGFAVLVFEVIGGQDGINFVLPFFMFIFIMALGQDYNILVMTRIREEAHFAPLTTAVRHAVEATGTTVTSAGLILAGTFGVLTATGDTQIVEIGVGLAAGILLDTFFVRTLLVPSIVVLLGRWNWWPSRLYHEDRDHGSIVPGPEWPARHPTRHPARHPRAVGATCEPSTVSGRGQPTEAL